MKWFGYCYEVEGNLKKQKKKLELQLWTRLSCALTSILCVAKATLPLELRHSRFERGKNETRTTVWQRSHHAEGNGVEKKKRGRTKLENGEDKKTDGLVMSAEKYEERCY